LAQARFLADESCDYAAIRALREAGHDVLCVGETDPGTADEFVLALALADDRLLLTEDKDFGQLVFAANHRSAGVILIRFPAPERSSLGRRIVEAVERQVPQLRGVFVVLQPRRTRVNRVRV
jgi:predicted nuclease of predicted toxin-antitoxin system